MIGRALRHLFATHWLTRRRFNAGVLGQIEAAVKEVETQHAGEIRFAVETAFDLADLWYRVTPRQHALEVFGRLGVWDTEQNNGVLIYILMADRDVEIVADRGIASRVTQAEWDAVCRQVEDAFRRGDFAAGSIAGVHGVGRLLKQHFPARGGDRNEQPNQPVLL